MSTVTKYTLRKAEGHGKAVCAFYPLPQGCRNGANCQFRHIDEKPQAPSQSEPVAPVAPPRPIKPIQPQKQEAEVAAVAKSNRNAERNGRRKRAREEAAAAAAAETEERSTPKRFAAIPEANGRAVPVSKPAKSPARPPVVPMEVTQQAEDDESSEESSEEEEDEEVVQQPEGEEGEEQEASEDEEEQAPLSPAPSSASKKPKASTKGTVVVQAGGGNPFENPTLGVRGSGSTSKPKPVAVAASPKAANGNAGVQLGPVTVKHIPQFQPPKQPVPVVAPSVSAATNKKQPQQQAPRAVTPSPVANTNGIAAATTKKQGKKQQQQTTTNGEAAGGSSILQQLASLPISPPSVVKAQQQQQQQQQPVQPAAVPVMEVAPEPEPEPEPQHEGDKWRRAVQETLQHTRYVSSFKFPAEDPEWVKPKKHGAWCKGLPHVLALDCEMCATRDPVSNEQNGKALIRLSVVDGSPGSDTTLIDTLVLPSLPVVDYRSDIHGIKPSDLEGVRFTFRHAQAAMLQICCDQTVLIGHGLSNDLLSLKLQHTHVVDTSFLFQREDSPGDTPALKDLASAIIGADMPEVHDSVADARVTLHIARHFLENGAAEPVPRVPGKKAKRTEHLACCLLVHRIPDFVTADHLHEVLTTRTKVMPDSVDGVNPGTGEGGLSGRATVRYLSREHAELAFRTLVGPSRPDKSGLPQKRLMFANKKDYVQVRMMVKPETPL